MESRSNFVVGSMILISILLILFGVFYLKQYKFNKQSQKIFVVFNNVSTLTLGDPVMIAGVRKGKVKNIDLNQLPSGKINGVLVELEVDEDVKLSRDSRIIVQNIGLMGERMVGVELGESEEIITAKDTIQGRFDSGIAEVMGGLGLLLNDVKGLVIHVQGLIHGTIGQEDFVKSFNEITTRINTITISLDKLVHGNEQRINEIIQSLHTSSRDIQNILNHNRNKINPMVDQFDEAAKKIQVILKQVQELTGLLNETIGQARSGEGTVGKFLQDDSLYHKLRSISGVADTLLQEIRQKGIRVNVDLF